MFFTCFFFFFLLFFFLWTLTSSLFFFFFFYNRCRHLPLGTFKRQKLENGEGLVYMMFVREPLDPYKKLKEEAKLAHEKKQLNSNYVHQDPVVAVCEKYAIDLQRVFMAYV